MEKMQIQFVGSCRSLSLPQEVIVKSLEIANWNGTVLIPDNEFQVMVSAEICEITTDILIERYPNSRLAWAGTTKGILYIWDIEQTDIGPLLLADINRRNRNWQTLSEENREFVRQMRSK